MPTGLDHSITLALPALEIAPFAAAALIVAFMVLARR
jgi:hypothetical protein